MLCSHHLATLEQHNSSTKWSLLPHNTTVQGRIPQISTDSQGPLPGAMQGPNWLAGAVWAQWPHHDP